jgi:hypothetical protein
MIIEQSRQSLDVAGSCGFDDLSVKGQRIVRHVYKCIDRFGA